MTSTTERSIIQSPILSGMKGNAYSGKVQKWGCIYRIFIKNKYQFRSIPGRHKNPRVNKREIKSPGVCSYSRFHMKILKGDISGNMINQHKSFIFLTAGSKLIKMNFLVCSCHHLQEYKRENMFHNKLPNAREEVLYAGNKQNVSLQHSSEDLCNADFSLVNTSTPQEIFVHTSYHTHWGSR